MSLPTETTDWERRRLIAAVLLPVLAFLALTAVRIVRQPALDFDEHIFLDVGRHIVDTGLPTRTYASPPALFFDHTPLYVYFVALVTAIGGPTAPIIRASTLVFGVLTIVLVFMVGRQVRGVGSGFVGAMLVAINPFFIHYSWFIRMEVPLCFFLVLAVYLLINERLLLAGLAIAVAVMLKEIALAFWLVATVYVFARRGIRAAAIVAIPAALAFAAWLAYAASLDQAHLLSTMRRWLESAEGSNPGNRRFHIGLFTWTVTIVGRVVGPLLIFAAGAATALAVVRRERVPAIAVVPAAYVVIAVVASFLMSLKEPRFLIAVVPMTALFIALVVDWDDVWTMVRSPAVPPVAG
jgi:4-amino-4-deoxy-L-arabinose transferase-like glycosyltransferase